MNNLHELLTSMLHAMPIIVTATTHGSNSQISYLAKIFIRINFKDYRYHFCAHCNKLHTHKQTLICSFSCNEQFHIHVNSHKNRRSGSTLMKHGISNTRQYISWLTLALQVIQIEICQNIVQPQVKECCHHNLYHKTRPLNISHR